MVKAIVTFVIALGVGYATVSFGAEAPRQFNIASQDLAASLNQLAVAANVQIVFAPHLVRNMRAPAVVGSFTQEQALRRLLEGTNLTVRSIGEHTYAVEAISTSPLPPVSATGETDAEVATQQVYLAQHNATSSADSTSQKETVDDASPDNSQQPDLEEVIVTGTRFSGRNALTSPVPVDIVSAEALRAGGHTELTESLAATVPAFNFQPVSAASTFSAVRPFTLRGLPPNEVLVLVNGKRWHPTAASGIMTFNFNSIPPTSVSSVEVLRDGASAQYGSDAIAGVMNIRLRNDARTELLASTGQYYEGDGLTLEAAFDTGAALGEEGYIHLSTYFRDSDKTNRQGRDVRQQYFAFDPNGNPVDLPVVSNPNDLTPVLPPGFSFDPRELTGVDRLNNFTQGNAERREAGVSFNSELPLGELLTAYGFGGYTYRTVETPFLWRLPRADNNVRAIHPDGYGPIHDVHLSDAQLIAGVKGEAGGWDWDVSESWGFTRGAGYAENSLNPSFGAASPTSFFLGVTRAAQATTNLDARRDIEIGLRSPLRVAVGSEYRHESLEVTPGEPASYANGGVPVLDGPRAGASAPIGSSGIGGTPPADAVDTSRHSIAGYLDLESQLTDSFLITAAGRYEHYNDFGSTVNGKLAFRQEFNPTFAVRGSISTGFRAPSLLETYFSSTSSLVVGGQFFINRNFPVGDPVSQALGVQPLEPEKSVNYSIGSVITLGDRLSITADVYRIYVRDVIIQSSQFSGAGVVNFLASRGFSGINSAQFFTNAVDKRVDGVDLTGQFTTEFGGGSQLTLSTGVNFNDPKVLSVVPTPPELAAVTPTPLFNQQRAVAVEQGAPRSRINVSALYGVANFEVLLRSTRYGSTRDLGFNPAVTDQTYGAKWLTDLDISYEVNKALRLTAGAQNLFDVYPDKNNPFLTLGGILTYPFQLGNAPFGTSGGHYYVRAQLRF
jgi:iron complex outermembrane recepter protein